MKFKIGTSSSIILYISYLTLTLHPSCKEPLNGTNFTYLHLQGIGNFEIDTTYVETIIQHIDDSLYVHSKLEKWGIVPMYSVHQKHFETEDTLYNNYSDIYTFVNFEWASNNKVKINYNGHISELDVLEIRNENSNTLLHFKAVEEGFYDRFLRYIDENEIQYSNYQK